MLKRASDRGPQQRAAIRVRIQLGERNLTVVIGVGVAAQTRGYVVGEDGAREIVRFLSQLENGWSSTGWKLRKS